MQAIDRRQALGALAGALATTLLPGSVKAQATLPAWPVNTLKLMAPVPASGGVDVLCRRIADRMGVHRGVNVVVENKPVPVAWSAHRHWPPRRRTARTSATCMPAT